MDTQKSHSFTRSPAFALALLAALWIAAVGTGTLGTDDTDFRLRMTHAWLSHIAELHDNSEIPTTRKNTQHGVVGAQGKRVIFYDPGQSLLMAPADWIAEKLSYRLHVKDGKGLEVWAVNDLVFLPLNVALILTCYWTVRLLGFGRQLAALTGLVWLLATTVLPYAQIPFQNNQVLLFSLLSCALILQARLGKAKQWLFLSGLAAGMAFLMRASAAIHVVTAGLFLLASLRIERIERREALQRIGVWLAGAAPFFIGDRLFDYVRYGSLFATGQSVWLSHINSDPLFANLPPMPPGYPFINPAAEGILGALFSPAKSIFLYDPLLLPCLIAGAVTWRSLSPYLRALSVVALVNLGLHLALTAKLEFWHGDWAWAARYHLSSVDLLLVFLLPSFIQRALGATGAWAIALRTCVLAGIVAQLLAVTMPIGVEVAAEDFQEPVECERDEWNSKLEFRLGDRARDLYCLATDTNDPNCPTQRARTALMHHPECAAMVRQLLKQNHLAFFPFDPEHRIWGYSAELVLWGIFTTVAVAWTGIWFARATRRELA